MKYYLVKQDANWGDEMDVSGFCVLSKTEYKKRIDKIKKYKDEIEVYIGTNESLEFDNGKQFIKSCLTVEEISKSDADVLSKYFSGFDKDDNICTIIEFLHYGEDVEDSFYEKEEKRLNKLGKEEFDKLLDDAEMFEDMMSFYYETTEDYESKPSKEEFVKFAKDNNYTPDKSVLVEYGFDLLGDVYENVCYNEDDDE